MAALTAPTDAAPPCDLRVTAERILADYGAPPVLVLAAWQYLYGSQIGLLPALARSAASVTTT